MTLPIILIIVGIVLAIIFHGPLSVIGVIVILIGLAMLLIPALQGRGGRRV